MNLFKSTIVRSLIALMALGSQTALAEEAFLGACNPGDFVTVAAPSVNIAISGNGYTPKCIRVKRGTQVTIGATPSHPLQGVQLAGVVNPIYDELGGAVAAKTVVFAQPGTFGYFCTAHGDDTGIGMAGAILVE